MRQNMTTQMIFTFILGRGKEGFVTFLSFIFILIYKTVYLMDTLFF